MPVPPQRRHLSDDAALVHIKVIHSETHDGFGWQVLNTASDVCCAATVPIKCGCNSGAKAPYNNGLHGCVRLHIDETNHALFMNRINQLRSDGSPTVRVTKHGPYLVEGVVEIRQTDGTILRTSGPCFLCRCGGSKNKPFCDATHGLKGFDSAESASRDTMADRRVDYPRADGGTVHDDRSRCAHFGQCTARLPAAFDAHGEPFVHADAAPLTAIFDVVKGCSSGALTWTSPGAASMLEEAHTPSMTPVIDGPYRIRGVPIIGADGVPYERRERQTLCRCGGPVH